MPITINIYANYYIYRAYIYANYYRECLVSGESQTFHLIGTICKINGTPGPKQINVFNVIKKDGPL